MTNPRHPFIRREKCNHNPGLAPGAISRLVLPNPKRLAHDTRVRVWRATLALPLALLSMWFAVLGSAQ
jgi:hypothetical protein